MKHKIFFIVSLLFGIMFINSGLNKFFNYMPMPENLPESIMNIMGAFMQIKWLMPLVGIIEIVAGALFISKKYRALGAVMILPVMIGIIVHHAYYDPAGLLIPLILLAIVIWALVENKDKISPLFK